MKDNKQAQPVEQSPPLLWTSQNLYPAPVNAVSCIVAEEYAHHPQ